MVATETGGVLTTETQVLDQLNRQNSLLSQLTVSNGNVVWVNPQNSYITRNYMLQPSVSIEDIVPKPAIATANVGDDGTISGITKIQDPVGYASPVSMSIAPTIAGGPGSGATIDLTSGYIDPQTKEFFFDPSISVIKQPGSNYVIDLNQQNKANANTGAYNFDGTTDTFTIKTNEIRVFNFKYGTGKRKENVDNP